MRHFAKCALLFGFLAGCCGHPQDPATAPALVAKRYAATTFGFSKPKIGNVQLADGYYSVWIWDEPRKPGGFVIVNVSKELKVLGWQPGR